MSEEDSVSIVPEEEVYRRIEEKVLSFPEVAAFTTDIFTFGIQFFRIQNFQSILYCIFIAHCNLFQSTISVIVISIP